jgi:LDH2 family malate/lactate/ureidoglycolate dehydrogenase
MSFQASSRAFGDDRQVNAPGDRTMREKSACNFAGAAVETAEIAELRTLVS